jgi:hypothetical protein
MSGTGSDGEDINRLVSNFESYKLEPGLSTVEKIRGQLDFCQKENISYEIYSNEYPNNLCLNQGDYN